MSTFFLLSKPYAKVGDEVMLTCAVKASDGRLPPYITWIKRNPGADNEEIEIGTNKFINFAFNRTNRYTSTSGLSHRNGQDIFYLLTIKSKHAI